jgi:hypothetical protein
LIVHSFSFEKERTKKANPDFPSGTSLSVPLFKEEDEKNINIYITSLAAETSRAAGGEMG